MRLFQAAQLTLASTLLCACAPRMAPITDITTVFRFANLERSDDQAQIAKTIGRFSNHVQVKNDDPSNPVYTFTVAKLSMIEQLHAELAFVGKGASKSGGQVLNVFDPNFSLNYSTTNISGSIQTIVSFNVTPGSILEVRLDNGSYEPKEVDAKGRVQFSVKIERNQVYIYGRTKQAAVCKEIRIKIETNQLENLGLCK